MFRETQGDAHSEMTEIKEGIIQKVCRKHALNKNAPYAIQQELIAEIEKALPLTWTFPVKGIYLTIAEREQVRKILIGNGEKK